MSDEKIKILERALERAKLARKQAEEILEKKSLELYEANHKLASTNKMMEALLDDNSSQMNIIFQNSSLGIFLSSNGTLVKTNQTLSNILGYSAEEFDSLTIQDVSHEEDLELTLAVLDELETGRLEKFNGKKRFRKKDGTAVICNLNVSSIKKPNGEVKYLVALLEDVTIKSQQSRLLRVLNELSTSLLGKRDLSEISWEIAKVTALFLKLEDCVVYVVNQDEQTLTQIAAFYNKTENNQIVNPLTIEFGKGIVGTVAQTGKPEIIHDTSVDDRYIVDDAIRLSEITVPIIANGKVIGVIDSENSQKNFFTAQHFFIFQNIASLAAAQFNSGISLEKERKKEKERLIVLDNLAKSNEELKNYAHIVSHDLKSPLRSMNALISWILEDNEGVFDEDTLNNFNMLLKKIDKMDHLINGILKYSSIDKTPRHKQLVDSHKLIEDIIDVIYIPDHITIIIKNTLPKLNIDKFRLQQLFQNLIVNAIKYNDKDNGIIEIDVAEEGQFYVFSIMDNGVGIDTKYHKKIFEVFGILNQDVEGSTGIGLSIVEKIVKMFGGEIWLDSEVGKHTTFFVKLKKSS